MLSASGPSRLPRWRPSRLRLAWAWASWPVFRFRFRLTPVFSVAWRPALLASSISKATGIYTRRRPVCPNVRDTNPTGEANERIQATGANLQPEPRAAHLHARQTAFQHLLDVELSLGSQPRPDR